MSTSILSDRDLEQFSVPAEHLPYARELVTRLPYTESQLRTEITQVLGAASSCWENLDRAGVFDSDRCKALAENLIAEVIRLTELGHPSLGCATTGELEDELAVRQRLGHTDHDYRPTD